MALNLGSLFFRLFADTKGVEKAEKQVKKSTSSMKKSFIVVGASIAAAFAFNQLRKMQLIGEEMLLLDIRLKAVSESTREFTRNQQQLLKIADKTGQSFKSVVVLFEKMKLASKDLSVTNDQILLMTDLLNKLGVIGGSSATEINNSLRQLSQAFAGGIVRAEEFNSIVENTPAVARAIAEGMSVSVGEMRKMVIEGRLLSEDVMNAILKQQDAINERMALIPRTSSMAWQAVENQASQAIKLIIDEIDSSEGISGALDRIAEKVIPFTRNLLRGAQAIQAAWQILVASFKADFDSALINVSQFINKIKLGFEAIPLTLELAFEKAIINIQNSLNSLLVKMKEILPIGGIELINVSDNQAAINQIENNLRDLTLQSGVLSGEQHQQRMNDIIAERDASIQAAKDELQSDLENINTKAQAEKEAAAGGLETIDAGEVKGSTDLDEAAFQDLMAKFGDETEIIAAAHRKRQEEINKIVGLGLKERAELEKRSAMMRLRDENRLNMMRIASVQGAVDSIIGLISQGNAEQSTLGKIALGVSKGLAVAQAAIALQQNIAEASKIGFPQNIPMIAGAVAQGASIVSSLSSISTNPGRVNGGPALGGFAAPVVEDGAPEIFENARGTFLIPGKGQGGIVSPMEKAGGGGNISINIIDNAGVSVTTNSITPDQLEIILDKRQEDTINTINASLASGEGDTFDALKRSTQVNRNIR